jgi:hypothetical protein
MGNWDDIPDDLVPDKDELGTLHLIVAEIREAVKIRHDLEEALSRTNQERRLNLRPFESTIGKSTKSIDPKIYEKEHQKLAAHVMGLVKALKTEGLKDFLVNGITRPVPGDRFDNLPKVGSGRIQRFLPDISGGPKGEYLRVLARPDNTILNQLVPNREDWLIRLLLITPGMANKINSKLPVGKRMHWMRPEDGAYYW